MSSLRTPRPTSPIGAVEAAIAVATAIVVGAGLLIGAWLFACADDATIGVSSEHGALGCPDCTEGVAESENRL